MGIIFDIQRFCVHDGPGIRTTVFLKGCQMVCPWCHNPESIKAAVELGFDTVKCVSCGVCSTACTQSVHGMDSTGKHIVDFGRCTGCGDCIKACPGGALKLFGEQLEANRVIDEVLKDKKYYDGSGGGVTFTGGEPTMQFGFLMELLQLAKQNGLHTALETNGAVSEKRLALLLPYTDLFLLDYKATGPLHRQLTGVQETVVLETFSRINAAGKDIVLRCPIIQGINDDEAHFEAIRELRRNCSSIREAEVMAYHTTGKHKWDALGIAYAFSDLPSATPEMKARWEAKIMV